MHNAQTDGEQQAINGVEDSLPGYIKQFHFLNGQLVGYQWQKVTTGRSWRIQVFVGELTRKLKWNW